MIAPKVSYDMSVVKAPQATITKKPVSFFDTTEPAQPPKQAPAPAQPPKQAPAPAPAPALKLPNRRPVKAQQELQEEDHVSELENLHIGITGIIDRHIPSQQQTQPLATTTKPTKPKRVMTEKQLAHLANMRKKKAEKRATLAKQQPTQPQQPQQPIQQAIPQQPTQPRQQTQPRQPTQQQQQQPMTNIEDVIKTQFERLYNEKETIRQNQKAIRRSEKQKVLDKIIAQQRLNAIAHQQVQPVVQPVVQPPPPKVESTAGKKHRYRMNPHGGIETYYE